MKITSLLKLVYHVDSKPLLQKSALAISQVITQDFNKSKKCCVVKLINYIYVKCNVLAFKESYFGNVLLSILIKNKDNYFIIHYSAINVELIARYA